MSQKSTHFTHAISRTPSKSIVDGLRAVDVGAPDYDTFLGHHTDYVAALRSTGAEVTVLPALDQFPDSVFVEGAAPCLQEALRSSMAMWAQTFCEQYMTSPSRVPYPPLPSAESMLKTWHK